MCFPWKSKLKISELGNLTEPLPDNRAKISMCLAEFFGTALILFFGCLSCSTVVKPENLLNISFSFGFAVMTSIVVFGHISGGHFNPAVTVASVIYGKLHILMCPLYILSQYLGAVTGFALLKFLIPPMFMQADSLGICTALLNEHVTSLQGLWIEFMATGALILVCCGVWDERNANHHDSVAIKFGLFIVMIAIVCAPYTSAGLNPARAFAPALINGDWHNHWVYIVGPFLAGIVFPIGYLLMFGKRARHTTFERTTKFEFQARMTMTEDKEMSSNI